MFSSMQTKVILILASIALATGGLLYISHLKSTISKQEVEIERVETEWNKLKTTYEDLVAAKEYENDALQYQNEELSYLNSILSEGLLGIDITEDNNVNKNKDSPPKNGVANRGDALDNSLKRMLDTLCSRIRGGETCPLP